MRYKKFSYFFLLVYIFFFHILESYSNSAVQIGTYFLAFPLFLCWILESIFSKIGVFYRSELLLIFYIFYALLTCVWSWDINYSFNYFFRFFSVALLYVIMLDLIRDSNRLFQALLVYVLGVLLIALSGLKNIIYNQSYNEWTGRFSANGFDPNNFGIILNIAVIFIYLLIFNKKIKFIFAVPIIFLFSFLIFSTGSRASLGVFVLGLFLISLLVGVRKPIILFMFPVFLFIFSDVLFEYIPIDSLNRAMSGVDMQDEDRFLIWRLIIDKVDGFNFLIGHGFGTTVPLIGMNAHNTFISNYFEGGFLGLLSWSAFIFYHYIIIIISIIKTKSFNAIFIFIALIILLGALLTLNWEFRKDLFILFAVSVLMFKFIKQSKLNPIN